MRVLPNADLTGHTIGRYAVVAFIQGGAQGRVYRGHDELLCRDVAIKALNMDDKAAQRSPGGLLAEAQVLSSITHANVAGVYDFVTDDGRDYIVMEFVPGPTLGDLLAAGPLSMTEVVRLGSQLARGLAAIHAANIAHCDIKPANLKITASGVLKIVDFGVARRLVPDAVLREPVPTGAVIGTFPYMAPEVLRGEGGAAPSDIFSAGAVLYELATGWRAFPQRALPDLKDAINNGQIIAPSLVNPLVPASLDRIVIKALQRAPLDRYCTATALAEAIEEVSVKHRAPHGRPMLSARGRFRRLGTTVAQRVHSGHGDSPLRRHG
jgi:serine/threonine-protein kinase